MTETRITGTLPSLEMELLHREHPEENAESVTIRLVAKPGFQAASGLLAPLMTAQLASLSAGPLTPLAGSLAHPLANPLLAGNPVFGLWRQWFDLVWGPWLKMAGMPVLPPVPGPPTEGR